ncbi:hypothetical protein JW766_04540 [Candidatus Dojkabacteria bacterium]|nr:hypothetical protein [Candidatus Dojkabacteria bacterium]
MGDEKNLKDLNTIAYDRNLRDQLARLHEMLGVEITDVASGAMEYTTKFRPSAENTLKVMSKLASDLSVALIEAKGNKKVLSEEEREDYKAIEGVAETLGNLQYKLNKLIKSVKKFNENTEELQELGFRLAQDIMDAQDQFRNVRANMNALGHMSENPHLASLFESQNGEEKV